ncbi:hypothetical protein OHR86_17370 [Streptomyces sp. NBC_00441]|uniref:hypothetical protein n=1 Tax=Streptomyces sp. NBC_00441 TaxID=2975742 RepID=UPI002E2BAEE6|nr:hypothetical protein [Streptomyces sp. NBC_00441]
MKKLTQLGILTASALMVAGFGASPATAANTARYTSCKTTGATGDANIAGWKSMDKGIPSVQLSVYDSLSDGHHASIRLGVTYYRGGITYYPWHANNDGAGTWKMFNSYVPAGSDGITAVWVQVARYEGSTQLNLCSSPYLS